MTCALSVAPDGVKVEVVEFVVSFAVTAYPVIVAPPSVAGAVHETSAEAFPATAVTPVGLEGAVITTPAAR